MMSYNQQSIINTKQYLLYEIQIQATKNNRRIIWCRHFSIILQLQNNLNHIKIQEQKRVSQPQCKPRVSTQQADQK